MAWRSSSSSNAGLVENMWSNGLLTSPLVKAAFLRVDRAHYAPSSPYEDSPQPIGHHATISAPHMHASAVESLLPWVLPMPAGSPEGQASSSGSASSATVKAGELQDGLGTSIVKDNKDNDVAAAVKDHIHVPTPAGLQGVPGRPRRVLDIGSGSGYLTHVLAELVGPDGVVVGVEHIGALRDMGERNMGKSAEGAALLASGRARFREGDGRRGWVEPSPGAALPAVGGPAGGLADGAAPGDGNGDADRQAGGWDAIHVGAAAAELHQDLVDQLRCPGRMFIPVGGPGSWDQHIWTVDKDEDGKVTKTKLYGVRYVPLTDAPWKGKRAAKEEP